MTYELTSLDPLTIRGKHAGGEQWWKYEGGEWWHCCDHKGPWVGVGPYQFPPGEVFACLLARLRDTERERDAARADVVAAAGELRVEVPEPGTVTAQLLAANSIMRQQRDTARSDLAASKAEVEQREAAARGVFEHIAKLHPEMPGPVEGKAVETLGAFAVDWWTRWQETQAEVERLRQKNRDMNRRWQVTDTAFREAKEALDKNWTWRGGSFGRAMLAYHASQLQAEVERLTKKFNRACSHHDLIQQGLLDSQRREESLEAEVERLRGVIERLSRWPDCGCSPCTGACQTRDTLLIELEERIELARAALTPAPAQPVSEPYKLPAPAAVPASSIVKCECGGEYFPWVSPTDGAECLRCVRCGDRKPRGYRNAAVPAEVCEHNSARRWVVHPAEPHMGVSVEICVRCGMSRSHWEQGESAWVNVPEALNWPASVVTAAKDMSAEALESGAVAEVKPAEVCECGHGGDWHTRRSAYGCLVSGCICPSFRPAPAKEVQS